MKTHFESAEEFKDADGNLSPDSVAEEVEYMTEHTEYGYRFIYADMQNLVSRLFFLILIITLTAPLPAEAGF